MWHFSMQGLPAIDVTINGRELLPHVFTLIRQQVGGQLFSAALSLSLCREAPCYGVHYSVLSGLSFPIKIGTITRFVAERKGNRCYSKLIYNFVMNELI
jgi:hypothetical protein